MKENPLSESLIWKMVIEVSLGLDCLYFDAMPLFLFVLQISIGIILFTKKLQQAALNCQIIIRMHYYVVVYSIYVFPFRFKLSCFDSAVRIGSKRNQNTPLLAQPVSAPEQWQNHIPSPLSDAWALGALIRFACTGNPGVDVVERSRPPFPYSLFRACSLRVSLEETSITSLLLSFFVLFHLTIFTVSCLSSVCFFVYSSNSQWPHFILRSSTRLPIAFSSLIRVSALQLRGF